MPRIRLAFPLFLFAVSSFAQNEPAANINESSTVITTASQLRRIEPPSPTASVVELEQKADILRVEKYYADAVDYYDAALQKRQAMMGKSGPSALIKNFRVFRIAAFACIGGVLYGYNQGMFSGVLAMPSFNNRMCSPPSPIPYLCGSNRR